MDPLDFITSSFSPRPKQKSPENEGLQIFCNKELVGYLQLPESAYRGKFVSIGVTGSPTFDAFGDAELPETEAKRIDVPLVRKTFFVDEYRMMQSGMEKADYMRVMLGDANVPSYASERRDEISTGYVLSWHVANVSVDQYEVIFDLDAFSPC